MTEITGIHHITCISGAAQDNVDFYEGVLGMRLVKRSVNQDSPGTYHLFYADNEGHPGSDLTFFPWPEMSPAKAGAGLAMEVSLAVPLGSIDYWADRLRDNHIEVGEVEIRRGTSAFSFADPHGLPLAIHETSDEREFTAWPGSPVPIEKQIRGLHTVRLWESDLALTSAF
ncbi:MAG: VOC family protein [Gemmatimonadaceae bacterium]